MQAIVYKLFTNANKFFISLEDKISIPYMPLNCLT
nr:MAG TPA: hypothetical protein [Caudoviricetes sp.]